MRRHAVTSHRWDYVIVGVVLEVGRSDCPSDVSIQLATTP
jgi:hypothetical protein